MCEFFFLCNIEDVIVCRKGGYQPFIRYGTLNCFKVDIRELLLGYIYMDRLADIEGNQPRPKKQHALKEVSPCF